MYETGVEKECGVNAGKEEEEDDAGEGGGDCCGASIEDRGSSTDQREALNIMLDIRGEGEEEGELRENSETEKVYY